MRRRDAHVELKQGVIYGSQERPDVQAAPQLTIDTVDGTLASRYDCTFAITRSVDGTRVICASGLLYFQPKGQADAVELEGGFFGEWSDGRGQVAAAETNATAQAELSATLEAVPPLRALRDAGRQKLPK
ncbi:MAG: hypothetical protein ABR526_05890 [Chthoniobacterales bacterium]